MSDLILESNRSSVILSSLAKAETVDVSYEINPSFPIITKNYREVLANNQTAPTFGSEVSFNLNKSMLLRDLVIRSKFLTATTAVGTVYPGLSMFEWIQIKTNNKVLFTITDVALKSWVEQQPSDVKIAIMRMALPSLATTEAHTANTVGSQVVCYTYVPCSFFDSIKSHFDLNFYEQLSITCKLNTQAKLGSADTAVFTFVAPTLWAYLYRPDDNYYSMLRSKNQSVSKPLNMLTWNTYTERLACTGDTTTTMRLNANYPVFKTVFRLRNIVAAGLAVDAPINSFTFSIGGTEILTSVPRLVGNWEKSKHGASSLTTADGAAITRDDGGGITIDWGLEPQNWTSCSGGCSFSQLNYPQLTVNYSELTAASYEVAVTHFYWQITTLDSTNGSVQNSVNS